MKRIFLLVLFGCSAFLLSAQSLLWKVSGKNMKSPSYLYGTFHIQDQRVFAFDSTVWYAFNECEAYAGELDMTELDTKAVREQMVMPDKQTIHGMLSKEDFAILDSLCKAKLGISALFLNTTKPIFIISALGQTEFKKDKSELLDVFFANLALKQGKSHYGLESYMDQFKALDALKIKDQVQLLVEFLHDTTQMVMSSSAIDTLLADYRAFRLDKLVEMTKDPSLPAEFNTFLVKKRNVKMADEFLKIAKKEQLFCAIGAGHLGGDDGVVALLRKKGYVVEPVVFKWND